MQFEEETEDIIEKHCIKTVKEEAKKLCSSKKRSFFRLTDAGCLPTFSYKKQEDELKVNAPLFLSLIKAVAVNPRAEKRNKFKTPETIVPSLMNSINTILMCRNRYMNRCAFINSLVLKRGKADKMCFGRFHSLNSCLDYKTVLLKQEELGKDFTAPVLSWSLRLNQEVCAVLEEIDVTSATPKKEIDMTLDDFADLNISAPDSDTSFFDKGGTKPNLTQLEQSNVALMELSNYYSDESEIEEVHSKSPVDMDRWDLISLTNSTEHINVEQLTNERLSIEQVNFSTKFMIVGDNLDLKIKRRHMTEDRQNIDLHLFHTIAVKNRVHIPKHLLGIPAHIIKCPTDIQLQNYFPNHDDEVKIQEEIKILVPRDLTHYVEDLHWAKKFIPKHIKHAYSLDTQKKSEIVSCVN